MKEEHLHEENYKKGEKKLLFAGIIILCIGIILGLNVMISGIKSLSFNKSEEEINLKAEKNKEFMKNGFSKRYYELDNELKGDTFAIFKIPIGAGIIGFSLLIGIVLIVTSKKRKIISWQTQQVIPIAQESIDKMSETVIKTAKKIKREMKQGPNHCNYCGAALDKELEKCPYCGNKQD